MKRLAAGCLLVLSPLLRAQAGPAPPVPLTFPFPAGLKSFLEITGPQADELSRQMAGLLAALAPRYARIADLNMEIAELRTRESLDEDALKTRLVEIEKILKDLRDDQAAAQRRFRSTLTAAQQAKLRQLEDAEALRGRIAEAQCMNLVGALLTKPAPREFEASPAQASAASAPTNRLGCPAFEVSPFPRIP